MNSDMRTADRQPRIQIQLSDYTLKMLTLWASAHGRPPSTFASQIVASKIEANINTINELVASAAEMNGISREEQIKEWLGELLEND